MKKKIIVLTVGTILINIVLLSLFALSFLKVMLSCMVILMAGFSLYFLLAGRFKPAFRYGIGLLLPFMGITEYVISLLMPAVLHGNWGIAAVVLLWIFQWLLLLGARYVSAGMP